MNPQSSPKKETIFGVLFEGWQTCAMYQGSESKRQYIEIVPTVVAEFYWGIGKGYFLEPRHIGAGVCSLS